MKSNRILTMNEIQDAIMQIAPKYPIKKVQLFGSYADGKAKKNSDIDLMIESNREVFTLFHLCGFGNEIEEKLSKKVDLLDYSEDDDTDLELEKVVVLYEKNS